MNKKFLMLVTAFAFATAMLFAFSVTASAADKWEREPNDEFDEYMLTLEDNNNYGYISSDTDMDIWKTFFFQDGYANFWLGNIPSGCDYALYVMDEDHNTLGSSFKSSAKQQLVSLNVEAGKYYYIVIFPFGDYNAEKAYKMRAFCYPDYTISSVPLYMQEKTYTCNMACARMILASYGVYVSEDDCLTRADIICNAKKNTDMQITHMFG